MCCTKSIVLVGEEKSACEIMNIIKRDVKFYEESGGGITLSGGEPAFQPEFALAVLESAHDEGIDTAIETCGYCSWKKLEAIIRQCDHVLYDVKHTNEKMHEQATGVSNDIILENLYKIAEARKQIIIRVPLIPGFNDTDENLKITGRIAKEINAKEIHVLPFHQVGQNKWHALDRNYSLENMEVPTAENTERVKKKLEESSMLYVNVGGYGK